MGNQLALAFPTHEPLTSPWLLSLSRAVEGQACPRTPCERRQGAMPPEGVARPGVTWRRTEGLSARDGGEEGRAGTVLFSLSVFINTANMKHFSFLHSDG